MRLSPAALWRRFAPECVATVLLIAAFALSAALQPRFLDAGYLFDRAGLYYETALLALAMTFVIVAGQIDLSITSILALVGAVVTTLNVKCGVPFALLIPLAPVLGGLLGWVNGALVGRRGLPSLVVTLGTMALYRGAAQILLGDHSLPVPDWFRSLTAAGIPHTYFSLPLLLVAAAAVGFALVLHRTVFGRRLVAVGVSPEASRYAAVPVSGVIARAFVTSGVAAGIASLMMLSRLGVARYDHARGLELDVITAVVLGGTSIFGGRGTIYGSVAALLLIAVVQTGMGVAGVKAEVQVAAIGALLIAAVLIAKVTERRR